MTDIFLYKVLELVRIAFILSRHLRLGNFLLL
jgi:hypothetical protein